MIKIDFLSNENKKKYPPNDIGISRLFIDSFKDELLFCGDIGAWYIWSGACWKMDSNDGGRRHEMLKELAFYCNTYIMLNGNNENQAELIKLYAKLYQKSYRDNILNDSASIAPIDSSTFDQHKYLFNCKNGTYDFERGIFRDFERTDYITDISNVVYDASATCPRFEKYLSEVMEDNNEKIDYLLSAASYCLTGDTSQECFFILYGEKTRNGKSTFVGTLANLMGSYFKTLDAKSITRKQVNGGGSGASPDLAKLKGARIASVGEIEDGTLLDIALIKRMTGNNTLTARFLYKDEFEFTPQFKIIIDTNFLPRMTDDTVFTSGRIHLINFNKHFEPYERDTHLKEKLRAETAGIFNLLATYYKTYTKKGFVLPSETQKTINQYQLNSNNIMAFAKECLVEDPTAYEMSAKLYEDYKQWCDDNGLLSKAKKNFKESLIRLGAIYDETPTSRKDKNGMYKKTYWIKGFGTFGTFLGQNAQNKPKLTPIADDEGLPF